MSHVRDMRIIVTGAGSGIGRATARLLAAEQARVIVSDISPEAALETEQQCAAEDASRIATEICDVRDATSCQRLVEATAARWGGIDALVHCAAILRAPGQRPRPLHDLDEEDYDAVIETNLKGTFLINRAVIRAMLPQKSGQIINLSSTSGRTGRALDSIYCASKAGVIGLSEAIAEEVRTFGIRVQVVLPDAVDTALWQQNGPGASAPPGSLQPDRVAQVLAFCLQLPEDATFERLVITPQRQRRRRPAVGKETAGSGDNEEQR